MKITRRMFTKSAPVAVPAAPSIVQDIAQRAIMNPRAYAKCGIPAGWPTAGNSTDDRDYLQKNNAVTNYLRKNGFPRRPIREFCQPICNTNPNIDALRSISLQHKRHMNIAFFRQLAQEEQSWQNAVMKMFDIKDRMVFYNAIDGPD